MLNLGIRRCRLKIEPKFGCIHKNHNFVFFFKLKLSSGTYRHPFKVAELEQLVLIAIERGFKEKIRKFAFLIDLAGF